MAITPTSRFRLTQKAWDILESCESDDLPIAHEQLIIMMQPDDHGNEFPTLESVQALLDQSAVLHYAEWPSHFHNPDPSCLHCKTVATHADIAAHLEEHLHQLEADGLIEILENNTEPME
jgi:hypothetical protein